MPNKQKTLAWLVYAPDASESHYLTLSKEIAEEVAADYGWDIVPLVPQQKISDDEKKAVASAAAAYAENDDDEECAKIAAALQLLLKRICGST